MDRTERFYRMDRLLRDKKPPSLAELARALEVSRATVKRDIEYLRSRFAAPVVYDPALGGYRYDVGDGGADHFLLPGIWFSEAELHALLGMESFLAGFEPGLLGWHFEPLRRRIRKLLEGGCHSADDLTRRIRIQHQAARPVPSSRFPVILSALLERRQLHITHYNRKTGETYLRRISPQRLTYYRDNWYLDAWCHLREDVRRFAVDAMTGIQPLDDHALDLAEELLDRDFFAGYGIFVGCPTKTAVLRFSPESARWVAREVWHDEQ
ncbi:MAG: WYL domain-containing protein, partial [Deltaproteobacteria bacterium]|nr:WYL domain-containing protein [Candidatus Anaeroferrophillacea bacterium]